MAEPGSRSSTWILVLGGVGTLGLLLYFVFDPSMESWSRRNAISPEVLRASQLPRTTRPPEAAASHLPDLPRPKASQSESPKPAPSGDEHAASGDSGGGIGHAAHGRVDEA